MAFSGGVDSSLVALLCSKFSDVTLLTVGFKSSHDVEYAARIAKLLRLPHHIRIISDGMFYQALEAIRPEVPAGMPLSWYENGMAFRIIGELAEDIGLNMIVTANGIDELFCGYDLYRRMFHQGGAAITDMIMKKTTSEIRMMHCIGSMVGPHMEQPLLGSNFVGFAATIPMQEKIRGSDDMLRKHAVRQAASLAGLPPDVCNKRKKALQYGTRIHQHLLRSIRQTV